MLKETGMLMARITLDQLTDIDGFVCAALVDSESGLSLATAGAGLDLELAAAGNTEVVRAKHKVAKALKLDDVIEDIRKNLGEQLISAYTINEMISAANKYFATLVNNSLVNNTLNNALFLIYKSKGNITVKDI